MDTVSSFMGGKAHNPQGFPGQMHPTHSALIGVTDSPNNKIKMYNLVKQILV